MRRRRRGKEKQGKVGGAPVASVQRPWFPSYIYARAMGQTSSTVAPPARRAMKPEWCCECEQEGELDN